MLFDIPARRLLERAYGQRGVWVSTRVADPGPRHVAWAARLGINVLGRDNASTRSGRHQDMRTRWVRAYVRALYYQHKWFSPTSGTVLRAQRRTVAAPHGALEVRVGRRLNVLGVLPAGRQVEVRIRAGGETARRAVYKMDESERIWTGAGEAGGRFAEISGRDW